MVSKWVISYNLLINGVYWGYNPLILTVDPNFQRDIQVVGLSSIVGFLRVGVFKVSNWRSPTQDSGNGKIRGTLGKIRGITTPPPLRILLLMAEILHQLIGSLSHYL